MNYILILAILFTSNGFAYNFDDPQAQAMDELSQSLRQQDIENRINDIEMRQRNSEQDQFQKDMEDIFKK